MKAVFFLLLGAFGSSAFGAEIARITCKLPKHRNVAVVLERIDGDAEGFYEYRVDILGQGKLSRRSPVKITEVKDDVTYFEVSKNADADLFSINSTTKKGWVSLLFPDSPPFEFEVDCVIK